MYYIKIPEWLFIVYSIQKNNLEKGCFIPEIHSSIPFATKDEAERYKIDYLNNIESVCDNFERIIQFAVIPMYYIGNIKIICSGNRDIRVGKTKALRVDTYNDKSMKWTINSEFGATIEANGNTAIVKCPDGDYVGQTITVKTEVDGITDECVLNVVSDV